MSPALTFREHLRGHVAFGDYAYRDGYRLGREQGTRLVLPLTIVIDDIDAFIAEPDRRAVVRGRIEFDELGISLPIHRGEMRVLVGSGLRGPRRVYYCIGARTERDGWVTVRCRKLLDPADRPEAWSQMTTVETRVLLGPPELSTTEDQPAADERTIATGLLRLGVASAIREVTSSRARARSRAAGALAIARFWAAVAGAAAEVYVPRAFDRDTPEPARPAVTRGPRQDEARPLAAPAQRKSQVLKYWRLGDLRVEPRSLEDDRGSLAELEHVTIPGAPGPDKGPVLLVAGSSVGASIFRPVGVNETIIHRLSLQGYDVWVENWRGSQGHAPSEYSLDEAAAFDHPRAVEYIAMSTGSNQVKAVVHCLGSSSFMLALASGRLHTDAFQVTKVVSNSVSLHPVLPESSERKLRAVVPVINRLVPYLDPRWAEDQPEAVEVERMTDATAEPERIDPAGPPPPSLLSKGLVQWVERTGQGSEGRVSGFAQWMYGGGPSSLYDPRTLDKETLEWLQTQFAWAPMRLYQQIGRSLLVGHLVPMRDWTDEDLRLDLFRTGPADVETRITFITGTENRCFSPLSQRRTYEWFSKYHGHGKHRLVLLRGFGHLDVWLRPDAGVVYDEVVKGLLD
jgi:hypothetical protein